MDEEYILTSYPVFIIINKRYDETTFELITHTERYRDIELNEADILKDQLGNRYVSSLSVYNRILQILDNKSLD